MNTKKKAVKVKDYEAEMKKKSLIQRFLERVEALLEKNGKYLHTLCEE